VTPPTVAILYPGEMGTALATLLRTRDIRVVTTLDQRSRDTADRARAAGIEILPNLDTVIATANVVLSVVPPGAAADVARDYTALAHLAPPTAIYADVNSVRPDLARELADTLDSLGVRFVDAAINGLAKNLATTGTLYLSGQHAADLAPLFTGVVKNVHVLGDQPGQASAMKMLLGGLSKGVCALFTELALLAERQNALPDFAQAAAAVYPGIWTLVQRMLPTYAQHAPRRATEMGELEQTARSAGLEPCLIAAIRQLHEQLAATPPTAHDDVVPLIRQLAETGLLTAAPAPAEMIHSALTEGTNHGQ